MARDPEDEAQPSSSADGDGGDDDGVTLSAIGVGQSSASITVNVKNAPAGARLDAWIDFNGDTIWDMSSEWIARSYAVTEGDNLLRFDVPFSASTGTTRTGLSSTSASTV